MNNCYVTRPLDDLLMITYIAFVQQSAVVNVKQLIRISVTILLTPARIMRQSFGHQMYLK